MDCYWYLFWLRLTVGGILCGMLMVQKDWIVVCAGMEGLVEQERVRLLFSSVSGVGKPGECITVHYIFVGNPSVNVFLPGAVCLHNAAFSVFNCLLLSIFLLSRCTCQQTVVLVCMDVIHVCSRYGSALERLPQPV